MSNEVGNVTPEMVEHIAKIVAREVVTNLKGDLTDKIGAEVANQLKSYFGDMTAAQHSIQHANLEKLLTRLESISSGFFDGIISKITSILTVALILGIAAWGMKNGFGN
ncbi:hypothetical protein Ppb6_00681 [Photorhabdus australis subsp. thailandensis]|uniref:Uncharacterized protein n=1 Tax=Photorhabdus australis subsp. thailandensis TaxID=2805096 RepID=A0A1C0U885_9GAMM|nr:hypothetical protein [Photorhabdus australis]OCQ54131.1 hypothetical protein Ppb6_00681 [Photorhabdus australis subsp. thailandensis]